MSSRRPTSVREALRAERLSRTTRDELVHALASPFVWPSDPELVGRARAIGAASPAPLRMGEACLVSVSGTSKGQVPALWTLTPRGAPTDGSFAGDAARSLLVARALTRRDLPVLLDRCRLETRPDWRARLIFSAGDSSNRTLDGPSYQLAMCLAEISLLLGKPMPSDLLATARVDSDGRLQCVGEVTTKLDIIARSALGVRRVLVCTKTPDDALEAVLREAGRDVTILRPHTLSEAVEHAFGHPDTWLTEVADAHELVEDLFTLAVEGSTTLLRWQSVAHACAGLLERPELLTDPSSRQKAVIARQIALRHDDDAARIDWPHEAWLRTLRRPHRTALVGHLIQSAADADLDQLPTYLDRAASWIARPPESGVEDLGALGAEGRARAASGDYEGAAGVLEMVVSEWRSLRKIHEASRPLCELLRVLGILDRAAEVDRFVALVTSHVDPDPRLDPNSRAFLHLAAGRALVQVGAPRRGLDEFLGESATFDWQRTSTFVSAARLRWKACAHRALGESAAAAAAMTELDTLRDWEQSRLARLDEALAADADVERAMRDLLALDGPFDRGCLEARRSADRLSAGRGLEQAASDPSIARRLAREFRY